MQKPISPASVHYPIIWLPIYKLQNANQCSPKLVIAYIFLFYFGITTSGAHTAASFGQTLTVIGATVSAFPRLSNCYYSKGVKQLSFLPSRYLLLKMPSSISKEKCCTIEERDYSVMYWLIGWLVGFRVFFTSSSFLHFENNVALSSSKQSYLTECLLFAKASVPDVFTYTSPSLILFFPSGWFLFLHSELTWETS